MKTFIFNVLLVFAFGSISSFTSCSRDEDLDRVKVQGTTHQGDTTVTNDSTVADRRMTSSPASQTTQVNVWGKLLIDGESKADSTLKVTIMEVSVNINDGVFFTPRIPETLMDPVSVTEWSCLPEGLSFKREALAAPLECPFKVTEVAVRVTYVVREHNPNQPLGYGEPFRDTIVRYAHPSSSHPGSIDVDVVINLASIKFFVTVDGYYPSD